jgi:hypothetical protein
MKVQTESCMAQQSARCHERLNAMALSLQRRASRYGSRLASRNRRAAAWFAGVLCVSLAGLALAQLVVHWRNPLSPAGLTVGAVSGGPALLVGNRLRPGHRPPGPVLVAAFNLVGALAVIPTLLCVKVANPTGVLAMTQAMADGYISALFIGLLPFIRSSRSLQHDGSV